MRTVRLIRITTDGSPEEPVQLSGTAKHVCSTTANLYKRAGYNPPWVCYLALEGEKILGTCGFTSSPVQERVEIAYFTFPENEGRGVATEMASRLVSLAQNTNPTITVFALTLPRENASTAILRKLGFRHIGQVEHAEDGTVWEWELPRQA